MSTTLREPRRLPASAIPDGCLPWAGEQPGLWARQLPPRWVPMRVRARVVAAVTLLALLAACGLAVSGMPPVAAAFLALPVVWLLVRPEVVRIAAMAQIVVVVVLLPEPSWLVAPCAVLLAVACVWSATLRLGARARQREAALAAAGGVTAPVPEADALLRRGRFYVVLGFVVLAAGAALAALSGAFDGGDDRHAAAATGFFVAGLGLTILFSGLLSRRRALALRRAPVPVLRVLLRESAIVDTEVFAADDVGALRPLFTVSLTDVKDDEEDSDDSDDESSDAEVEEALDRIADDEPGPLREAVLYGAPYDGAELMVVSAAEEPDEPPLVERSTGPVRPLSDGFVRRELLSEKYLAARDAKYRELGRVAAEAVAERSSHTLGGKGVRRWRAGWPDWLSAAVTVVWGGSFFWGETGVWRYLVGAFFGILGVLLLPRWVAWRITADSEGLWFNGWRRTQHIAWDHIRVVECKGTELKVDSWRASFEEWSVTGFRWPWLERRTGLIHPYELAAAEIWAMWKDPAVRPLGVSGEGERKRVLWPLGALGAVAWIAALVLLP